MRDRNDAPVNKYVFQLISGDLLNIIATIANDKYTIIKNIMGKTTLLALFNCSFVTVPPLLTVSLIFIILLSDNFIIFFNYLKVQ